MYINTYIYIFTHVFMYIYIYTHTLDYMYMHMGKNIQTFCTFSCFFLLNDGSTCSLQTLGLPGANRAFPLTCSKPA